MDLWLIVDHISYSVLHHSQRNDRNHFEKCLSINPNHVQLVPVATIYNIQRMAHFDICFKNEKKNVKTIRQSN